MGSLNNKGYAWLGRGGKYGGNFLAHRVSYELHKGPIPEGLCVLHSCDTPACVNPDHLRAGTLSENIQDCIKRNRRNERAPKGEAQGHSKLTETQVRHIKRREMLAREYAALYGVHRSAISLIWQGRNWAHIQ
jgi:hypothetical protein